MIELRKRKGFISGLRHRDYFLAVSGFELQDIAAEVVHLLNRNRNYLFIFSQRFHDKSALIFGDRFIANYAEMLTYRHHHIGVINRRARGQSSLERHHARIADLFGIHFQHFTITAL
ncbi:Uncharacterised protein [Vibrio cholerae]|nr:Uncharacterised protein [Vibrio cholerae]CSB21598.1 Uncharacterised protein [Vibrio cholerae]CSB33366.1 Uncharacterised protein [Vibrio cholerae]CSB70817.1 Uncharacterised protein [Vibrio cholerae]CSC07221.1 Uncharacterised protein [Vibrio cholerae]